MPPDQITYYNTPERQNWWRVSGIYYGYPQCCVDAFCRLDHHKDKYKDPKTGRLRGYQIDVSKNTGFVPCRKCAERIHKGEVKLQDLIVGRSAKRQFPRQSSQDDIDAWWEEKISEYRQSFYQEASPEENLNIPSQELIHNS